MSILLWPIVGPRRKTHSEPLSSAPFISRGQSHCQNQSGPSSLALPPSRSSSSPAQLLKLQIPGAAPSRITPSRELSVLQMAKSTNKPSKGYPHTVKVAFEAGGYYGGPATISDSPREVTIRPLSPSISKSPYTIEDIENAIEDLRICDRNDVGLTASAFKPEQEEVSKQVIPTVSALGWSDAALEEIARLGEGMGGAVHKVKDRRTGTIMARKTITTCEAPIKQLLRELSVISSTVHPNIVLFHGAYISPSSREVKILMEFCPGGSLEAIGKQIADRNEKVGEKVAGRLAAGVSLTLCMQVMLLTLTHL